MDHRHPIVKTKFFVPQPISDYVVLSRLDAKLYQILNHPITLVSAPTGFGKSSLISRYLLNRGEKFAWLSIGEEDDELLVFIRYFILALQKVIDGFGDEVNELTTSNEPPPPDILAEHLVNEIAELK